MIFYTNFFFYSITPLLNHQNFPYFFALWTELYTFKLHRRALIGQTKQNPVEEIGKFRHIRIFQFWKPENSPVLWWNLWSSVSDKPETFSQKRVQKGVCWEKMREQGLFGTFTETIWRPFMKSSPKPSALFVAVIFLFAGAYVSMRLVNTTVSSYLYVKKFCYTMLI